MKRRPLSAGEMNARITLQSRAPGQDSRGQPNGLWQDTSAVWAKAEPLRGRDLIAAGQMQDSVDTRFSIRYLAGVTSAMRVVCDGTPYDIVGTPIDVDLGHHTLELMCASGLRDAR